MENNIISEIGTDSSSILSYDGIKVEGSISTIKEKVDLDELEIIQNDYTNLPVFIHWHDKNKTVGTRYSVPLKYSQTLHKRLYCPKLGVISHDKTA